MDKDKERIQRGSKRGEDYHLIENNMEVFLISSFITVAAAGC